MALIELYIYLNLCLLYPNFHFGSLSLLDKGYIIHFFLMGLSLKFGKICEKLCFNL